VRPLPPKATHQQTKTYNQQLVLKAIFDHGQISRAEVARMTELTRVTVSEIVADLLKKGLVAEVGRGPSAGGKSPILLSVVEDAYHLIGVDLANDEFRGAVVNLRGDLVHSLSLPLLNQGEAALEQVYELVDALIARTAQPLLGIGIGTPGLLDTDRGIIRQAVNLGWKDLPLGSLLQARFHLPVYLANDSQVTALAEQIFGAGKGELNLVVVKVGRGIGAGIVLNGQLHQGDGFGAGEIGHIAIDPAGEPCRCGNNGCVETVASTRAIARRARALAGAHPESLLNRLAPDPAMLTIEEVLQAYAAGDSLARQVALEAGRALGFAIATLVSVLNAHRILLVGSVTRFGQPWLEAVCAEVRRCSLAVLAQETEIDFGDLGANAVILGASALLLTRELGLSLMR
jgi:glucokinase-like ROK family protein